MGGITISFAEAQNDQHTAPHISALTISNQALNSGIFGEELMLIQKKISKHTKEQGRVMNAQEIDELTEATMKAIPGLKKFS